MTRQAVINSRVAVDLGEALFHADPTKIFFIGHSFGCASGAILAAIEDRIDYFIFMTGVYSTSESAATTTSKDFVDWRASSPDEFLNWQKRMQPYDADQYLRYKRSPCLVQVANFDEYLTTGDNEIFFNAMAPPKELKKYDAPHALNEHARDDRMNWVMERSKQ